MTENEPGNRKVMRQVLLAPIVLGTLLLAGGLTSVLRTEADPHLFFHSLALSVFGFIFVCGVWYAIRRLFREMVSSKDHLSNIVRSIADPLLAIDALGRVRTINRAAMECLGYNALELMESPIGMVLATEKESNLPPEQLKKVTQEACKEFECFLLSKTGRKIPILLSSSVMMDGTGKISGIVCIARDISERKKAEAEAIQLQQQLAHSSKLASLGTIGSGVAHELNNPLTIVKAAAEMIELNSNASSEIRREAKEIVRCAVRMKKITDHLRIFARESKMADWEQMDVNTPIRHSLMLLNQKFKVNDIKLKLSYGAQLPKVWGDSSQLESVFQNLLTNSRDSFDDISDGRKKAISITTREDETGGITVEYEDNAAGIPPEIIERVFDPFFTTKEVGKGTGLGMSIIHGIIEAHRGKIILDSVVGRGTRFTITMPRDRREIARKKAPSRIKTKAPRLAKGVALPTLLIVDDEAGIAELLKLILKGHFKSKIFIDSREACKEIAVRKYDLVITDLQMPYVSGLGILAKVKECQTDTPLVLMSGHGDSDPKVKQVLMEGAVGILDKPFSSPQTVRNFLLTCLAAADKGKNVKARAA